MSKKPKQLTPRLSKNLIAYTVMAGGVALSASPAAAEVVYTSVHRPVRSSFYIDLNHDGIDDFHIYSSLLSGAGIVEVFPARNNRVLAAGPDQCFLSNAAAPLAAGAMIGPGKPFQASANCMAYLGYGELSSGGLWKDARHRYLGFAFEINGNEHFGWARLSLNKFMYNNTAVIEGYAYETVPNKPIIAGDDGDSPRASVAPASLGALAAGASSLSLWGKDPAQQ